MSVPAGRRKESSALFIRMINDLKKETFRNTAHFPKHYTFTISNPLCELVCSIKKDIYMANTYRDMHDFNRQELFRSAWRKLDFMSSEIDDAVEIIDGCDLEKIGNWQSMIATEMRLLQGLIDEPMS